MITILVVDDDLNIRRLVQENLEERGFVVIGAASGTEALLALEEGMPDFIILDLIMPGISGVDVCIRIRESSDVPIFVLSAHDEEELIVHALEAGADDYVIKPFRVNELLARIRAVMRRTAMEPGPESSMKNESRFEIGDLLVDLKARRAFLDGEDLSLTRTEFSLLAELAKNHDEILTHEELLSRVWGLEYRDTSYYLYVYFGRIRNKLGADYGRLVRTVPGIGYTLSTDLVG